MRKLYILFTSCLLLCTTPAYAQVTQGNATSTVSVQTTVNGSGTTTTHIETDVNGDDKVIDTNGSGSIMVEHDDKTYTVTTSAQVTIFPTTASSTPSVHFNNKKIIHHSFFTSLKSFFQNLFKFF